MSSPGNAVVPAAPDPTSEALQGTLRHLISAVGALLAGHGLIGPGNAVSVENWTFWTGMLIALAPIIWSAVTKFRAAKNAQERETVAVMAGISLVAHGAALATDGSLIATASSAPPKPVTPDTAKAIIANFGPTTDELNAMSLKTAKGS